MPSTSTIHTTIDDYLLYRRQFFLGSRFIENLLDWNYTSIDKNNKLTVHPDLELTKVSNSRIKLFLLGFILDAKNPTHSNLDILNRLLIQSENFKSLIENTYSLSGRWIIIYKDDKDIRLFNDAGGSRQIFYSFQRNNEIWCASQPHTIAYLLKLKKRNDPNFLKFINSIEFKKNENALFCDDTLFEEIYHLLPNHFLSLHNKQAKRYWPNEKNNKENIKNSARIVTDLLKGLYKAADNRFELIQPVTSGRDSRNLLAASRQVRNNITYFIQKFNGLHWYSSDIKLPKHLLSKLGLKFNVFSCRDYDDSFDSYINKNVYMIQSIKKKVLHYNFFKYAQGKVNVSGNYTGIFRRFDWQINAPRNAPFIKTTRARLFVKHDYIVEKINKWENNYKQELNKFNYYIGDLFYWENTAANWVPMFQSELDIAIEEWCPFNCREILTNMLSVKPENRHELQSQLLKIMWPDTEIFPVSPPDFFSTEYFKNIIASQIKLLAQKIHKAVIR